MVHQLLEVRVYISVNTDVTLLIVFTLQGLTFMHDHGVAHGVCSVCDFLGFW